MATTRNRDYSSPPEGIKNMSANYYWSETTIITGASNPQTGAWVAATSSPNGGTVTTYPQSLSVSNSIPSGIFSTGTNLISGLALAANPNRKSWFVQNLSKDYPLYVKLGDGSVSSSSFNFVLNPSNATDFAGGSYSDSPAQWIGSVGVSGNGKIVIWEI